MSRRFTIDKKLGQHSGGGDRHQGHFFPLGNHGAGLLEFSFQKRHLFACKDAIVIDQALRSKFFEHFFAGVEGIFYRRAIGMFRPADDLGRQEFGKSPL